MAKFKFKKGDLISPLFNRCTSNYYPLKDLKLLEFRKYTDWNRGYMECKIIEGFTKESGYSKRFKGHLITINENAFKLHLALIKEYEIF